jgi:hypothetical protein
MRTSRGGGRDAETLCSPRFTMEVSSNDVKDRWTARSALNRGVLSSIGSVGLGRQLRQPRAGVGDQWVGRRRVPSQFHEGFEALSR